MPDTSSALEPWQDEAINAATAVQNGAKPEEASLDPWQRDAIDSSRRLVMPEQYSERSHLPLKWGIGDQLMQGLTQGLYAPAVAAKGARDRIDITPITDRYKEERAKIQREQDVYTRTNPLESAAVELGGSAATAIPALALGGAAAEPLIARAGAALPKVQSLLSNTAVGRTAGSVVHGMTDGAAAGALQWGLGVGSVGEQTAEGAVTGGLINPISRMFSGAFEHAVSPRTAEIAKNAMDLGIPIRAADIPGAPATARAVGKFFPSDGDAKRAAATRIVAKSFGEDSNVVDYKTIQNARDRLGKTYDNLGQVLNIPGHDVTLSTNLSNLRSDASKLETRVYDQADKAITDIEGHLAAGDISGEAFKTMKGPKGALGAMVRSTDGTVRHFGPAIQNELQEAMERHSPAQYIGQLKDTNKKFKNLMIADRIADESTGVIDPNKLSKMVQKKYGTTAEVRAGELGTLSQAADLGMLKSAEKVDKHEKGIGIKGPALGAIGAVAGEKLLEHTPNLLHHVQGLPELGLAAGGSAAALGALHGKYLQTEKGTRNLLDKITGGQPLLSLHGTNPLIPPAVGYNNLQQLPEDAQ